MRSINNLRGIAKKMNEPLENLLYDMLSKAKDENEELKTKCKQLQTTVKERKNTRTQDQEIEKLNKIIRQKDEGIKAFTEDLRMTTEELDKVNNIINTILDFGYFKEECPLNFGYQDNCEEKAQDVFYEDGYCEENCNDVYKKCWLKYFERLQELKGSE